MTLNRRTTRRTGILTGVQVTSNGKRSQGLLHNFSKLGCRLTVPQQLVEGEFLQLVLALPDAPTPIEVSAVVVWCAPIEFSSSYQAGCSFREFAKPSHFQQLSVAVEKEKMRRQGLKREVSALAEDNLLARMSPLEIQRISFLADLSRHLNRSPDTDEVARTAVDAISRTMRAERVLLMVDRGGDELEVLASIGVEPEPSDGPSLHKYPYSQSLAAKVFADGKALLSFDVETDEELSDSDSLDLMGTRSVLCMPLQGRDKVFGLLYMDNSMEKSAFSRGDLEIARVLCELTAAALERSQFFSILVQTEKMAALGTLTASLAHELNNPLTVISGLAELLQEEPMSQGLFKELADATDRCHSLIRNITNWSRLAKSPSEELEIGDVVSSTMPLIRCELKRAGVQLQLALDPDLPSVRAHETQLSQVLVNLISNSIHALKGHSDPRISLMVTANQSDLFIRVNDNGPGIPSANLARIFDPFFTTKPKGEGTGLGLSVSRDILSRYGGTLEARNLPSGGAQLLVQLPIVSSRGSLSSPEPAAATAVAGTPLARTNP
jgi:signal transduction histidine kinase